MSDNDEGKGVLWWAIAIILLYVAFSGEPDVVDSIRVMFVNWAGL